MKKFILTSINSIVLIGLLTIACSREKEVSPVQPKKMSVKDLDYELISTMHNEAVEYIYANKLKSSTSVASVETYTTLISKFLIEEKKIDSDTVQKSLAMVEGMIQSFYGNQDLLCFHELGKEFLSEQLIKELNYIATNEAFLSDKEVLKNYLDNSLLSKYNWSDEDLVFLKVFVAVTDGSYNYWGKSNNFKSTELKCSSKVIISDGIGGILGSIFGPVGSIATGTYFSIASNENC